MVRLDLRYFKMKLSDVCVLILKLEGYNANLLYAIVSVQMSQKRGFLRHSSTDFLTINLDKGDQFDTSIITKHLFDCIHKHILFSSCWVLACRVLRQ